MSKYDQTLLDALLREDFVSFVAKVFETLCPGQAYLHNWHIEAIAYELMQCREGHNQNLLITMPPRYLKSICVSVAYTAYLLGKDPSARIICASYSIELAGKHSRDCRIVMESEWYRRVFPGTRLSPQKNTEYEFETTKQGLRLATSVGGSLTGRGGNTLIIDDSLKPADALSDSLRQKVNDWYDQTVTTRTDDKLRAVKIIVQQRLHQNDLVGHILAKGANHWRHLNLPARALAPERIQTGPISFHKRLEGHILHAEREPETKLAELRSEMGAPAFLAQYQQAPVPPGGNLVDPNWFIQVDNVQMPTTFDRIVQSWDTATKPDELADYSVCISFGLLGRKVFILNVIRKQLGFPDLKRLARDQATLFGAHVILIEDKSSGTQLLQELKAEGIYSATAYKPVGNKAMRLNSQTAMIENGFVHVPRQAAWLHGFLDELASFPNGHYDDQADALSQGLDWIQLQGQEPGFLQYMRELAEGSSGNFSSF